MGNKQSQESQENQDYNNKEIISESSKMALDQTATTKKSGLDKIGDLLGINNETTDAFGITTTAVTPAVTSEIMTTTTTKVKKTKTTTKVSTISPSSTIEPDDDSSNGGGLKTYGGIALGALVVLFILAVIIKKVNRKSGRSNIDPYQSLNEQGNIKPSATQMYSGPIYDPTKENQYSSNNNVSMGVATSVEAATLARHQQEEMDAANTNYNTGTLPNYNSPSKNTSTPPVPPLPTSMPQTSMAPSYNNYNQPQQNYGSGYDQYGQPQQNYGNGYDQYGQPQPPQPQPSYDSMGMNTTYNNSPYGFQFGNNYDPNIPVNSPLSLPVNNGSGVVVSATYSSSQTTSVKQPDGTVTETLDYATNTSYEVDRDYVAIYSYEPNMTDELAININDRIHLLEMYTDGWGYGKNVTTGQIGILPLNRLKIEDNNENKKDPIEELKASSSFKDISKRTVSMNKRPKAAENFDESKKNDDDKKSDKRKSDESGRRDRRRYDDDDDDYDRRRDRDRRRYDDDDDDYERRRDRDRRRRDDDDDDYERRRDRDRRRYDDDDDYERRKDRDRRRYDDDDDYERRKDRDRRRYDDDDDDYERRRDRDRRRRDDDERNEKTSREYERKKSYRDDENDSKSPREYERKKSYRDDENDSKSPREYERKKSYREEENASNKAEESPKVEDTSKVEENSKNEPKTDENKNDY